MYPLKKVKEIKSDDKVIVLRFFQGLLFVFYACNAGPVYKAYDVLLVDIGPGVKC